MVNESQLSTESYYDLGTYERSVSTSSNDAQIWFNRGLIWSYGFNHQASVECFKNALSIDPECAMAYWGLDYALGPNYNKPWDVFDKRDFEMTIQQANEAAVVAKSKSTTSSPIEQALIDAIQHRYRHASSSAETSSWNENYAAAMQSVYAQFPNDLDVAAIFADSLMNITPWALWDISTGEPAPASRTLEAKSVLDKAIASRGGDRHPGLLHLYIHLMEMSKTPEAAMPAANCLRGLVPDSGHLNHMPTHLDVLCGDYAQAIRWNSRSIHADEKYLTRVGPFNFYTLYRCHDYHFLIYAAMFAGASAIAINTATQLESSLPEEALRVESPPMADWLEGFMSIKIHVYVRFGLWQKILDMEQPSNKNLYCVTTAMIHYARGIAFSATRRLTEAREECYNFTQALQRVPKSRTLFNNTCIDILGIAAAMLDGELEYREGRFESAFVKLRNAIQLEDNLPYDEPWGWMQPTRHAYGALLLEQGHVEEAASIYRADLGLDNSLPRALQHPNNVWALHGYHECLTRLGNDTEACVIAEKLKTASSAADVPILSSCCCRQDLSKAAPGLNGSDNM